MEKEFPMPRTEKNIPYYAGQPALQEPCPVKECRRWIWWVKPMIDEKKVPKVGVRPECKEAGHGPAIQKYITNYKYEEEAEGFDPWWEVDGI